jgi:hypothetical protein
VFPNPAATPGTPALRRVLSLPGLILFGLLCLVPLTVFTTCGLAAGGRLLKVAFVAAYVAGAFPSVLP